MAKEVIRIRMNFIFVHCPPVDVHTRVLKHETPSLCSTDSMTSRHSTLVNSAVTIRTHDFVPANVRSGSDSLRLPASSVFAGATLIIDPSGISVPYCLDARQQSSSQRNFQCSVDMGESRRV